MSWCWVDTKNKHTPSTAYTEYSIHRVQHTPRTAYTEYSIHRVQHTAKIVYLPSIVIIMSWPLNVGSASGIPPYTINCHQPARRESSNIKSPCHNPTVASQLTDKWSPNTRHAVHRQPPTARPISLNGFLQSVSPNLQDDGLQVDLQTHSIMISECISKFTWSRLPSVFLNMLNYPLHVHLQTRSITASKCISDFTRSQSPSTSPNSLHPGL